MDDLYQWTTKETYNEMKRLALDREARRTMRHPPYLKEDGIKYIQEQNRISSHI